MDLLLQAFHLLQGSGISDILAALLMIIGGLKVIARYTPFKWDDEILAAIEKPASLVRDLLNKGKK